MKRSGDIYIRTGYGVGIFGLCIAILFSLEVINKWEIVSNATAISWGLSAVGIAFALIAIGIAKNSQKIASESDERMKAMANLEFYEKMAVVERYKSQVNSGQNVVVEAICNDIKAAKQLKKYVTPEIEQELKKKIQELIDIALQGQPYGNLASRLQDVQKEDC